MDEYISKPIRLEKLYGVIAINGPHSSHADVELGASQVLDTAALLDQMGGDWDMLKEVTAVFLADYPKTLAAIREALQNKDMQALEGAAHQLKGTVSQLAAPRATEVARRLEEIGRRREFMECGE